MGEPNGKGENSDILSPGRDVAGEFLSLLDEEGLGMSVLSMKPRIFNNIFTDQLLIFISH